MKIKVRDLLPNPFRNIEAYPIDPEKIRQLRNSIRETTFWDNILARPAPSNGRYQIAYGHHRLTAIKEELGKDTIVDIPVRDLSDEDMLRIMANENMEQWATDWRVIVETIGETRKFLKKHRELIEKMGFQIRTEIGALIISKFLGKNWPRTRVSQALALINDEEIKIIRASASDGRNLNISKLEEVTRIKDRRTKKEWIKQIQDEQISEHEMREIARFENDPVLTAQDKQTLRTLIQKEEVRGKEAIRRKYDIYRAQRLIIPKTTPEREKKQKQMQEHFLQIAKEGSYLAELISTLAGQISSHPETLEFFPLEETAKANSAMHDLVRAIRDYEEKYDIARSKIRDKGIPEEG